MKYKLFFVVCLLLAINAKAQNKQQDSVAIVLIDRMADLIGDLEACSFTVHTSKDVGTPETWIQKQLTRFDIYFSGKDKFLLKYQGDKGDRTMWYNGSQVAYYFKDEHNFGILPAPSTTMQMIDSLNAKYSIEFPAADFFYPAFTDDLLEHTDVLKYLGRVDIDGQSCFHILAIGKDATYQFWISADAFNLPVRFAISYKNKPGNFQYEAIFSNWKINPNLPSAMFDFDPPPGAAQVYMMPVNEK